MCYWISSNLDIKCIWIDTLLPRHWSLSFHVYTFTTLDSDLFVIYLWFDWSWVDCFVILVRVYNLCGVFIRLDIHLFGGNFDEDLFGYWGLISYDLTLLRDWISWYMDQYTDLIRVRCDLGFILDLNQHLDGNWRLLDYELWVFQNLFSDSIIWVWMSCWCWLSEVDYFKLHVVQGCSSSYL